jgi:hypothetical protein
VFKTTDPSVPQDALRVIHSLQFTDGPLVFFATDYKTDPDSAILVIKDGEQNCVDSWAMLTFRPIEELLEIDLANDLLAAIKRQGWKELQFEVHFSPSLRPSLSKLGIDTPSLPEQCPVMSFEITVVAAVPKLLH